MHSTLQQRRLLCNGTLKQLLAAAAARALITRARTAKKSLIFMDIIYMYVYACAPRILITLADF